MKPRIGKVLEIVRELRVMRIGTAKSPHQYLFVMALARLYENDPHRRNAFPLNDELERTFLQVCREIYPEGGPETILIEFPYYHLSNSKDHIWTLTLREGKEEVFRDYEEASNKRFTHKRLIETTEYGQLSDDFDSCLRNPDERDVVTKEIRRLLLDIGNPHVQKGSRKATFTRLRFSGSPGGPTNPFVSYLNSLQRLNASNENALAEYQACSPFFAQIHVPHPLAKTILSELKNTKGRQIILTGHAGDGKSTIALDVYKELAGIPSDQPLTRQPLP